MTTRNELAGQRAQRLSADERQLYESFRRLGMDPTAALVATSGRERLSSADPAEELVESFEGLIDGRGRDPERVRVMAENAACGRDASSLRQIRESLGRSTDRPAGRGSILEDAALSGPLTAEERRWHRKLGAEQRSILTETAEQMVEELSLSKRFGCDARRVAENRLIKEAHRRMREEGQ